MRTINSVRGATDVDELANGRAVLNCVNPVNHVGCEHPGWIEVKASITPAWLAAVDAARAAATRASTEPGLDIVSLRFFAPGDPFSFEIGDPTIDR